MFFLPLTNSDVGINRLATMQCVTNLRLVTRFVNSCIQLISTDRLTHCGAHTPRLLRSGLLRRLELVLRHGFLLDRLPAVIRSKRSYPAMPLAGQLADQRFTIPGPLVQRNDSLNSLPPPALPILSYQFFDQLRIGHNIVNNVTRLVMILLFSIFSFCFHFVNKMIKMTTK